MDLPFVLLISFNLRGAADEAQKAESGIQIFGFWLLCSHHFFFSSWRFPMAII